MFEVGELIHIKEQFWTHPAITGLGYNHTMQNMQGQEYTIKYKNINGSKHRYRLDTDDEHNWVWDENWLEATSNLKDVYTEELDLLFMGD